MTRLVLVLGGLAGILYGASLLLQGLGVHALIRLPLWLGTAVLTDDLLLIPLTLTTGWLLSKCVTDGKERAIVRCALSLVAVTTLIALPLMLRQGKGANPTVLSRDYRTDWLMLEAMIVTVASVFAMVRRFNRGRARSMAEQPSA